QVRPQLPHAQHKYMGKAMLEQLATQSGGTDTSGEVEDVCCNAVRGRRHDPMVWRSVSVATSGLRQCRSPPLRGSLAKFLLIVIETRNLAAQRGGTSHRPS